MNFQNGLRASVAMGGIATLASGRYGSRIRFAPETGSGTGTVEGQSEGQSPESTAEDTRAKDDSAKTGDVKTPTGETKEPTLSETEAKLLKDLMRHKEAAKTAKQQADDAAKAKAAIQAKLSDLLGIDDLEQLDGKLAELKKVEEEKLKASGDFEALRERIISENKKELEKVQGARNQEVGELKKTVEGLTGQIRKLTVSNNFAASKFIADELNLTPKFAEKLFGEHFKVEERDGELVAVAYRGKEPLVDGDGTPLSFDKALAEIVNADPDKDSLYKPKAKPGAGSGVENRTTELPIKDTLKGVDRIARGLATRK